MCICALEYLKKAYYRQERELARALEKIRTLEKRLAEQKENKKRHKF